jgi:DNA-directed RNA polymerase subunit M/transcription elongation factor TFIIS
MSIYTAAGQPETKCPSCGVLLLAPDWAESAAADRIVHIWNCRSCGEHFETVDLNIGRRVSEAEAIENFWPTVLIS